MTKSLYCPCSVNTFSQAFESRARFCFRQASTTMSPSFIWARQNRETSRAQASCPCCAEAVDANKTNGKTNEITKAKRIMDSASRRTAENGVLGGGSIGCNRFIGCARSKNDAGGGLRRSQSRDRGGQSLVATCLDLAANSLSITARQPALKSDRCFTMQAVIFGMLGISELQSLKASPVHCACASALKAKLCVEDTAEIAREIGRA